MTAQQVAADLRAAAEVLRRDGWTQGTYHRPDGCHCAEGAIALVVGQHVQAPADDEDWWENHPEFELMSHNWFSVPNKLSRRLAAERLVEEVLGLGEDAMLLHHWNDAHGRTADEVIAALEAAADAAEAQQ